MAVSDEYADYDFGSLMSHARPGAMPSTRRSGTCTWKNSLTAAAVTAAATVASSSSNDEASFSIAAAVLEAVELAAVAKLLPACLQLALTAFGLEFLRLSPGEVLLVTMLARLLVSFQIYLKASLKIA
jgi:hypothetical protein